jgi:hypothetical protein
MDVGIDVAYYLTGYHRPLHMTEVVARLDSLGAEETGDIHDEPRVPVPA